MIIMMKIKGEELETKKRDKRVKTEKEKLFCLTSLYMLLRMDFKERIKPKPPMISTFFHTDIEIGIM